jgi:hypothetical protein
VIVPGTGDGNDYVMAPPVQKGLSQ